MKSDEYIRKARRSLSSASILLKDGDTSGACNRAFYAIHNAARAAISEFCRDDLFVNIKTHSGLISTFSKEFIVNRGWPDSLGRAFKQIEGLRREADYTGADLSVEKTHWAINKAIDFVAVVEEKLRKDLNDHSVQEASTKPTQG